MNVLGLDVSTSCTGACVYDCLEKKILKLDHVDLKKFSTPWEKADAIAAFYQTIEFQINALFVEDIAMMYTPGMSSAGTIAALARFNGLASYIARSRWAVEPVHIKPAQARKLCGIKLLQKTKDPQGRSHKQQVFDWMCARDLKDVTWPVKKNGKLIDACWDRVDAYVIAKAGSLTLT